MDFIYKHYIRVEWFYALILHLEYNSTQNLFTHEKKKQVLLRTLSFYVQYLVRVYLALPYFIEQNCKGASTWSKSDR